MQYLFFVTQKGLVKKTAINEYSHLRPSGLVAIKLDQDDRLLSTHFTSGKDEVLLVTSLGKAIRFQEAQVRPTGRATRGVKGITLKKDDHVVSAGILSERVLTSASGEKNLSLLTITEYGYGKMTPLLEYHRQSRGGQGVFTHKISEKTGRVVDMRILSTKPPHQSQEKAAATAGDLLVVSTGGQTIRLPLAEVPTMGRHTQGVRLIKLKQQDRVAALTTL